MDTPLLRHDAGARRRELAALLAAHPATPAAEDYADRLAARYAGADPIDRYLAHALLAAYLDGWRAGQAGAGR